MDNLSDVGQLLAEVVKEEVQEALQQGQAEKNVDFVQVYRNNMKAFRKIIRDNPTAAELFYFLVEHMDRNNSLVCSSRVLEEALGKSKTTIWRSVAYLKERSFIETSKMGSCNVYHINASISWSSWANNRKYAKFNAIVLISESEQEDLINKTFVKELNVQDDE